jgi:signal transduction histidine kinase
MDPRGPSVELRVDLDFEEQRQQTRLEPELEATIYRLVQEALNNAINHAKASSIRIGVVEDAGAVTIHVGDDGAGFDPGQEGGGFGLVGMRERVELVGGSIEVTSEPGAGTDMRATVPARHRAGD